MEQKDRKIIESLLCAWQINNLNIPEGYNPDFKSVDIEELDRNDEAMLLKVSESYDDFSYATSVVVFNDMKDLFAVKDWAAISYAQNIREIGRYKWYHHTGEDSVVIRSLLRILSR